MATSRGKSFRSDELKQVCYSFLEISQDPCVGAGQKKDNFWDRVGEHYKKFKPHGAEFRSPKSLESKWGEIRHDVARFCGCYNTVESQHPTGTNSEDILNRSQDLYKQRHPKGKQYTYLECYSILKDYPRWEMPQDLISKGKRKGQPARKETETKDGEDKENEPPPSPYDSEEQGNKDSNDNSSSGDGFHIKRPPGCKNSKEMAKKTRLHEDAFKISAQAQKLMAETGKERLRILENQQIMNMFSMPTEHLDDGEKEFFKAWRLEEMAKMKQRMAQSHVPTFAQTPPGISHATRTPIPAVLRSEDEDEDLGRDFVEQESG